MFNTMMTYLQYIHFFSPTMYITYTLDDFILYYKGHSYRNGHHTTHCIEQIFLHLSVPLESPLSYETNLSVNLFYCFFITVLYILILDLSICFCKIIKITVNCERLLVSLKCPYIVKRLIACSNCPALFRSSVEALSRSFPACACCPAV